MASERRKHYRKFRPLVAATIAIAGAMLLSACAGAPEGRTTTAPLPHYAADVRVVTGAARQECVPYARRLSRIALRGDAWSWWASARGVYERGRRPEPGAVLVLKRQRNSLGHLAVVTRVIDDRLILVDHANWLNRGRIYENTPVRDVSRKGDWSAVRVWYAPGDTWGKSAYAAYGFIYGPKTNRGQIARTD